MANMDNCSNTSKVWKPELFLVLREPSNYAVLILNRKILHDPLYIAQLWKKAKVKVTVDGGTDRWLQFLQENKRVLKSINLEVPDLITGDFDSVKEETLNDLRSNGSQIVETPDQNETDFTKALIELSIYCNNKGININSAIVICDSCGRIDQIMANINTLFKCKRYIQFKDDVTVYLLACNSLSWLLEPGYHSIHIPEVLLKTSDNWCSLIPMGEKCHSVTTSGLKWNLKNGSMSFGELVSTSNTYSGSKLVNISTTSPLLWSMRATPCFKLMQHNNIVSPDDTTGEVASS